LISSQRVRVRVSEHVGLGLDWIIDSETGTFHHGGATAGFTADAFFNPTKDMAAIILSNVGRGTAASADVLGEHIRARLDGKAAISLAEVTIPRTGGVFAWLRLLSAYWLTMTSAGLFVFALAMSALGVAAAVVPRRYFLRASSLLQLTLLCVVIATYFFQPMVVRPAAILTAQEGGLLASSPSYWFLGLFQELSGSAALAPLARRAWISLGAVGFGAVAVYTVSYARTLRQIEEQPDVGSPRGAWLPPVGPSPRTAVTRFSVRTALRSAQHRMILAFYWGISFALAMIFVKSPAGQRLAAMSDVSGHDPSVPLLVSSVLMMALAVMAARFAFAMPRELPANWIFRVVPVRDVSHYLTARRRALAVLSAGPVWTAWAIVLLWLWPWQPALGHLLALALLGMILVEVALSGASTIPCTCSYLPGKSQAHLAVFVALVVLLPLAVAAATFERGALHNSSQYAAMVGALIAIWIGLRWRTAWLAKGAASQPVFEDDPGDRPVTLELWDSRLAPASPRPWKAPARS
jgi:hypothetical protein